MYKTLLASQRAYMKEILSRYERGWITIVNKYFDINIDFAKF